MRKSGARFALFLIGAVIVTTGCAARHSATGESPQSPTKAPESAAAPSAGALPVPTGGAAPLRPIAGGEAAKLTSVAWSQLSFDSSGTVVTVVQQRRLCVAAAALRPLNRLLIHARSKGR